MGVVAATRGQRGASREAFLTRLAQLAPLLANTRPTAVNLRWALDRMARAAAATPGEGAALWERLQAEATAIWEEDRAMCRRIGEAGLPLVPDGATVLTHCNAGALATGGIGTALAPIYLAQDRKSTRLNSSHSQISYAVFCLKKKKNNTEPYHHEVLNIHLPSDNQQH